MYNLQIIIQKLFIGYLILLTLKHRKTLRSEPFKN
jgi:hypothetical protein